MLEIILISTDFALSVVELALDVGDGGIFSSKISGPPLYSSSRNFQTVSFTTKKSTFLTKFLFYNKSVLSIGPGNVLELSYKYVVYFNAQAPFNLYQSVSLFFFKSTNLFIN